MHSDQEQSVSQTRSQKLPRRYLLAGAASGALGLLPAPASAQQAIAEYSLDHLLGEVVSPVDSLYEQLGYMIDLIFDVLHIHSEDWARATDAVTNLLHELERKVKDLVAKVPGLAQTATIQQFQNLTDSGKLQAALLSAEPPSGRMVLSSSLASLTLAAETLHVTVANQALQQQLVLDGEAVQILKDIRNLVLDKLTKARDQLTKAKEQYQNVAVDLRTRLEVVRKQVELASLEIARRLDPASVSHPLAPRVDDPVKVLQAARESVKKIGTDFRFPYQENRADEPRSIELLVDGLAGAAEWAAHRLRTAPATLHSNSTGVRGRVILAAQAAAHDHGDNVKAILAAHCPPGTDKRAQDLVAWVGPYWMPIIPKTWRKGRIRKVVMQKLNCPHLSDLEKMSTELANLAPSLFG